MIPFQKTILIVLLCAFKITSAQINLTNGLVAYYPFNGNTNDISGNNYNGTAVNGPILTTDRNGNANSAYQFDGIDDYIKVTDNGAFSTQQISISLWFMSTSNTLQTLIVNAHLMPF